VLTLTAGAGAAGAGAAAVVVVVAFFIKHGALPPVSAQLLLACLMLRWQHPAAPGPLLEHLEPPPVAIAVASSNKSSGCVSSDDVEGAL
jgi:hypothetical protein